MKRFFILLALVQVVFASNVHCDNCAKKIRENVSFEKGVKDLDVSVEGKTVTVTFNPAKTDTLKLKKAINKLGYTADVIEYKEIKK